ncbi:hypothetical protein HID58_087284, partial [Brassica napus]
WGTRFACEKIKKATPEFEKIKKSLGNTFASAGNLYLNSTPATNFTLTLPSKSSQAVQQERFSRMDKINNLCQLENSTCSSPALMSSSDSWGPPTKWIVMQQEVGQIRHFPSVQQMCFSQCDWGYQVRSVYPYKYLKVKPILHICSHLSPSLSRFHVDLPVMTATIVPCLWEMIKLTKKDVSAMATKMP